MANSLTHHGIKGMRWGVRRYQNKDGSYTAAGKKRKRASDMTDEELSKEVRRKTLEKRYNDLNRDTRSSKTEKAKSVVDASKGLVDTAKKIERDSRPAAKKMDLSNMTDQQLRDRINRANLERQYQDMFGNEAQVSKGRERTRQILDTTGDVLTVAGSALAIAVSIQALMKKG